MYHFMFFLFFNLEHETWNIGLFPKSYFEHFFFHSSWKCENKLKNIVDDVKRQGNNEPTGEDVNWQVRLLYNTLNNL
jgi:hypothetical protein